MICMSRRSTGGYQASQKPRLEFSRRAREGACLQAADVMLRIQKQREVPHALPAARRMEILTETKATSSDRAVQPTVEPAVPCHAGQGSDEEIAAAPSGTFPRPACTIVAIPTTTTSASTKAATTMPGRAD